MPRAKKSTVKIPTPAEMGLPPDSDNGNGNGKGHFADLPEWFDERNSQVREGIPILDEATYTSRFEAIKGQQRAVKLAQENLKLNNEIVKAEGIYLDGVDLGVQNDIKREKIVTTGVQLTQQQTKTSIERGKLAELQADAMGHAQQAQIKSQSWYVRLEGLKSDLNASAQALANKRAELKRLIPGFDPAQARSIPALMQSE